MTKNGSKTSAAPFGAFERGVARRYLGSTRKKGGVSLISMIAFGGIALSVATLIIVMSVFQGFRINILDQLLSVNGHVFVSDGFDGTADYEQKAERLRALRGVTRAAPVLLIDAYAVGIGGEGGVRIQGMRKEDVLNIPEVSSADHLIQGGFDTFGEGRKGGNEIALGASLAVSLGVNVGDTVTFVTGGGAETAWGTLAITQKDYKVGAIFSIGNSFFDQYYAYMPLEQAQLFGRSKDRVTEIELRVEEPLSIAPALERIAAAAEQGAVVSDWTRRNSDIFNALQVERGLMRIILLMVVAIATMLIISGLVMLVKDKRSDIAVLRTIGATQGMVMRIFLLVGASLGVSGALAGVVLGVIIASNLSTIEGALSALFEFRVFNPEIYYLSQIPSIIQWSEVLVVVAFTLIMSFLFSAYPAWRASKVDPVEALRYE
ncbi:MAG: lipoprotein-releasing ABC transporter permease subunit [Pseudomonadota bacterium]